MEVRQSLLGARDLHAAVVQLAMRLADQAGIESATLVAHLPRMSASRVIDEWDRLGAALAPAVARRLGLVALAADQDVALPAGDAERERIKELARRALDETRRESDAPSPALPWTAKTFQIWVVLVDAWLRHEGALPIQEIARRSGTSQPTIADALRRMQARDEIERTSSRAVALAGPPGRSLDEVLVLADGLRQTTRFADQSGRRDPAGLLRRIRARAPRDVGIGGVTAARHYVPGFDLNGLPRVDISAPAEDPLAWLAEVDPALREARPGDGSPVLVVNRILRPDPRFEVVKQGELALVCPAETLLDLHDLRLTGQARDFLSARPGSVRP